ncbi:MAG: metalloregulator ArsR/SmtB family transcription factor [Oceanospirillaceae bacterium]|nr:metalloregulator ArsR/SmtB family transcription factor [Oceanospirillaceae bacterium]
MKRVLFLCTANSARSQMAEALLRHYAGDRFEVFSAGTAPASPDPRALAVLEAIGVDTRGLYSKSVDVFADQAFDFVITLCSKAHQECRSWPGGGVVLAWDFDDPVSSSDGDAFGKTLQAIGRRIQLFIEVNSKTTDSLYTRLSPVEFYKALADDIRLKSLLLLLDRELCVCELVEALQQPQPKISRHLAQLRKSGLLLDRRQGQWVYYRLHPLMSDWMRDVIATTRDHNRDFLSDACTRLDADGLSCAMGQ